MTMPNERRNAVKNTMELLLDIVWNKYECSEELRAEARRCLKHYPSDYYMDLAAEQAPDVFGEAKVTQIYQLADVKFNNGNGALLCSVCRGIIAYGFDHEDKMHLCKHCAEEFPEEQGNE